MRFNRPYRLSGDNFFMIAELQQYGPLANTQQVMTARLALFAAKGKNKALRNPTGVESLEGIYSSIEINAQEPAYTSTHGGRFG